MITYRCRDVARHATEYIERRLSAATHADISRHLESCADCRTYVRQIVLVRDSAGKLPGSVMPEGMRRKLAQRLARVSRERDGGS
jgi:DNA-binding FrmR family transcriptional regulator